MSKCPFIFLFVSVCCSSVLAQNKPVRAAAVRAAPNQEGIAADAAARAMLPSAASTINAGNLRQYGLSSLDETKRLTLGQGVPIFYVRADQLKSYAPGTDAGSLMISSGRRAYPVMLDGTAHMLLTIQRSPSGWKFVSLGSEELTPALGKLELLAAAKRGKGPGGSPSNYFAVLIPAMHLSFLAYSPPLGPGGGQDSKRKVSLTPLNSAEELKESGSFAGTNYLQINPRFTAEGSLTKSADEVFRAIAPQAAAAISDKPH